MTIVKWIWQCANFVATAVNWQAFKSGKLGAELYEPIRGEKDIVLPDRKAMSAFGETR